MITGGLAAAAFAADRPKRILGKTGLKVTTLGFGSMRTFDPGVIRRAVEMGINHIDTARSYMDGYNEQVIGAALQGLRNRVLITSKVKIDTPSKMKSDVEASLKALRTDVIDILLLHSIKRPDELRADEPRKVIEGLKRDGLIRFSGFSTHLNAASIVRSATKDSLYDIMVVAYNFRSDEALTHALEQAWRSGHGIVAMKTQAGDYRDDRPAELSHHQAALKWVLSKPFISAAIPSMVTYDQLRENLQVISGTPSEADLEILHRYDEKIRTELCRFCGACISTCPHRLEIPEINRCLMYLEGYHDHDLARRSADELGLKDAFALCESCTSCSARCVFELNLAAQLGRARTFLG